MTPTFTTAPFDFGLVQYRATCGALVATGLAPRGTRPASWMVARVARRCCRARAEQMTLGNLSEGAFALDARLLAAVIRAGLRGRL